MKTQIKVITCAECRFSFERGEVDRECSNCFACTGCEIYLCPGCGIEIVVKPIGEPRRRKTLTGGNSED